MNRQRLFKLVRWALALTLVAVVLTRLDLSTVGASLAVLDAPTLAALLALTLVMPALLARRLQVLARPLVLAHGRGAREATLPAVLSDALAAAATGTVLPSSIGGDVVRALLVSDYFAGDGARARAVSLIFVDRLVGLLALSTPPIILGLVWHRSALGGYAVAAALALALVTWQLTRVLTFAARLVPRRWPRARAFFDALPAGVASVPVGPRLEAFCWSVLYQGCVGSFFELVAAKWGSDPRYHEAIWVGIPVAMVLTVIPLSIGGLGLREGLFVGVFVLLGLPREEGLALALMWGFVGLAWALAGAAVFLWRAAKKKKVASADLGGA